MDEENDKIDDRINKDTVRLDSPQRVLAPASHTRKGNAPSATTDLWSAAYREAVENLRGVLDAAIFEEEHIQLVLKKLGEVENEETHESAFSRGVRCLRSIQVPLETFKLALDLANPVANLEPVASAVLGVVRGVTAVCKDSLSPIRVRTAD